MPSAGNPLLSRAGFAVAVLACLWLVWSADLRSRHVLAVSALPGRARAVDRPDARSPTGRPDGQRELIVAERNEESFDWIAQTQTMLAGGPARIRHVDYDNAPHGRPVSAASPYRWWLGLVAEADHAITGRPLGLGVERAALAADPLLQAAALVGLVGFTGWMFGGTAAGVLALGWIGLFPLAAGFLPGMPEARGLSLALALASLLLVTGALRPAGGRRRGLAAAAGVVTGLGFWVSPRFEGPLVLGLVGAAAVASVWLSGTDRDRAPWRIWGLAGGITVLLGYAAEYFPDHLGDLDLGGVHPAYGIALVGAGELLALLEVPPGAATDPRGRWVGRLVVALAALLQLPALMTKTGSAGFLAKDVQWAQLSRLPGSPIEPSTAAWLRHADGSLAAVATLLPLLVAGWLVASLCRGGGGSRRTVLVLLGPVLAALVLAVGRLEWWSLVEVAVLAATVAAVGTGARVAAPGGLVAGAAALGLATLWPAGRAAGAAPTSREAEELVDRHLAHWLAQRSAEPGVVVLAPPHVSAALDFYGSLRGLGSFAPDNHAGFEAELNIAVARTMEEIEQDLAARQVRYLVVPSWDNFFEECGRRFLGPAFADRTLLISEIRRWHLPVWLRPIPYQAPVGGGASVLVFEVVPDQSAALAASRLAEYLVETGNLEAAGTVAEGLRRYPGDVGALVARAEVADAVGNSTAFNQVTDAVIARLANDGDRYLPWDRRVGLAVVLAQSAHVPEARAQLRKCLADATEARLRSLSTGSLVALLKLSPLLQVDFPTPELRAAALGLLPGDLKDRL